MRSLQFSIMCRISKWKMDVKPHQLFVRLQLLTINSNNYPKIFELCFNMRILIELHLINLY